MTDARIHDTGYRSFEGERRPVQWAILDLAKHGAQRVFGIKRQARHKLLPFAIVVAAFLPAIAIVGVAVMFDFDLEVEEGLPQLGEYFGIISLLIVLFASFVAPEALCTDRRTGMLGLYLASPLTRDTYLLGRFIGLFGVIMVIATGPQLLILVALGIEGSGPETAAGYAGDLVRILGAGLIVTLLLTSVTMAISSLTSRRGIASAMIVMILMTTTAVINGLIEERGVADEFAVFDIVGLAISAGERIFGQSPDGEIGADVLSAPIAIGAALAWSVLGLAFCRLRYQHIDVRQ
jgi:ABC-2 type transport system permease protein